jgi:phage FluMu gp28-like protein
LPKWQAGSLRPIWEKARGQSVRYRSEEFSLLAAIADPVWFWQLFGTYEGEPIVFEDWQVEHMHDGSRLRACEKAPQIGFSFLSALEAVHACLLFDDETVGFVSVDQREASEKVLYARKAYDGLVEPIRAWVPLAKDSTEQLDFGDRARPSRLMSLPATSALRGRRMSVYLDELDFYRDGGENAFRTALTRITRGGRVTMGSTCFGVGTQLDKVMSGEDDDSKTFSTARYPYTVVTKPEMVESIELSRKNLDEDDFNEEYGCQRGGGGSDTFSSDLIRQAIHAGALVDSESLPGGVPLILGYDVSGGTGRHPALLNVIGQDPDRVWRQCCIEEIRDVTLPDQEAMLTRLLTDLPYAVAVIDATGIGLQISQSLQAKFGEARVIFMQPGSRPADMDTQDRVQMVIEVKRVLEAGDVELGSHKEQMKQLRGTRIVNGKIVQLGGKRKTHYDVFWSLAYAIYGIKNGSKHSVYERRGLRVIDTSSGRRAMAG